MQWHHLKWLFVAESWPSASNKLSGVEMAEWLAVVSLVAEKMYSNLTVNAV